MVDGNGQGALLRMYVWRSISLEAGVWEISDANNVNYANADARNWSLDLI